MIRIAATGLLLLLGSVFYTAKGEGEPSERGQYSVKVHNLSTDGITIPDTPVPTPTFSPTPTFIPQPTSTPVPNYRSGYGYSIDRWAPLVADIFPSWAVEEALGVIYHESKGDPYVYNFQGSGACGLFQLLPCTCINPECNVYQAYLKWRDGGQSFYRHWYQWWN